MAKSQKAPQPVEPMSGKVLRKYLDTQDDFALELDAYRLARKFGFLANLGHLYDDVKTNKRRQNDVLASHENKHRRIYLTIECKSLDPTYPLLIQRIPRPVVESFHQIMQSQGSSINARAESRVPQYWVGAELLKLSGTNMYPSGDHVGKSMKRIKVTENGFAATDSEVYEKYTQALTSMNRVIQAGANALRPKASPGWALAFLPIVVVSNKSLWVADYDDGQLIADPSPADEATFYLGWDYEIPTPLDPSHGATFTISHLHIMTQSRLPKFLRDIHDEDALIWDALFGPKAEPDGIPSGYARLD